MGNNTTFAVPTYEGARLRELAKQSGRTAGAILADLINDACEAAGIGIKSSAVTVQRRESAGTYAVTLFEAYLVEKSAEVLESLAAALADVADAGGGLVDMVEDFDVYRQGSGVILNVTALSLRTRKTIPAHLSMSPDMARKVAKTIREAIA